MNMMPVKVGRDMAGLLAFPGLLAVNVIIAGIILPAIQDTSVWFWFCTALLFAGAGIVLLAYARLPLYRQKRFFAVGPGTIPEERRPAYRWAWRFVIIAIVIQVVLIGITR